MLTLSIITATFNSAATLRETLTCVANQTYANIEHIIVDGASSDDTLAIVAEFPHIAKCISEKDAGIYDAMNKGIALATGDVIAILNSDDVYSANDVCEKVMSVFSSTGCDATYGDLVFVDKYQLDKVVRVWRAGQYKTNRFLFGWMPPHPTFFVHKRVYQNYGTFDTFFLHSADYELMLRFIHIKKIHLEYIPRILVRFRKGGASNSNFKKRIRANIEDKRAWIRNGIQPSWFTIFLKPARKLRQYFRWFRGNSWGL